MLDDREERALAAMEAGFDAEDPGFRSRLGRRRVLMSWPTVIAVVGVVVGLLLTLVLGLVGNAFLLLLVTTTPLALRAGRRGWPRILQRHRRT